MEGRDQITKKMKAAKAVNIKRPRESRKSDNKPEKKSVSLNQNPYTNYLNVSNMHGKFQWTFIHNIYFWLIL